MASRGVDPALLRLNATRCLGRCEGLSLVSAAPCRGTPQYPCGPATACEVEGAVPWFTTSSDVHTWCMSAHTHWGPPVEGPRFRTSHIEWCVAWSSLVNMIREYTTVVAFKKLTALKVKKRKKKKRKKEKSRKKEKNKKRKKEKTSRWG